jgi:hypothetical protein
VLVLVNGLTSPVAGILRHSYFELQRVGSHIVTQ